MTSEETLNWYQEGAGVNLSEHYFLGLSRQLGGSVSVKEDDFFSTHRTDVMMQTDDLHARMATEGLWVSPGGKTPLRFFFTISRLPLRVGTEQLCGRSRG